MIMWEVRNAENEQRKEKKPLFNSEMSIHDLSDFYVLLIKNSDEIN